MADKRLRIARERHDVVAHAVGIMVVQAAAAEQVMEGDPERAREALASVQETGRAAVVELSRMLYLLRDDDTDVLAPLPTHRTRRPVLHRQERRPHGGPGPAG